MQCASGAGGNGLIERSPPSLMIEHLARLDVAHVGGADQVERAGLGADDPGVAEPAERERTEAVRIAHGDQPVLASAARSENAPLHLRDRLDERVLDGRRLRARVEVQDDLGVAAGLEDRALRARARRAARCALTRLPLWRDGDLAVRAVDQERLRVLERALAGRRVARVADRADGPAASSSVASLKTSATWPIAARHAHPRRRRPARCRRSPGRDAAARRGRGRSGWPPRDARRCRRPRTRL